MARVAARRDETDARRVQSFTDTLRVVADQAIERVLVEDTASPAEVSEVAEAFRAAGFDVDVDAAYGRKSAGALPWIVYATLAVPFARFFETLAVKAAEDAYAPIKAWIKSIWAARSGSGTGEGSIALEDPEHTHLILPTRLSDEALDALAEIDWDAVRGDYLVWDGRWHDPTKRRR